VCMCVCVCNLHGHTLKLLNAIDLLFNGMQASTTKFEIVHSRSFGTSGSCVPVKFIARRNWVVSGDNRGKIRVYTYIDGSEEVMKLEAHDAAVKSLAVHPTRPFLLSSSKDTLIKLWNWDNGWACTREFEPHWITVRHLAFNPRHTDSFASISGKYGSAWPGSISVSLSHSPHKYVYIITYGTLVLL
jgi:WD40 repeat protein